MKINRKASGAPDNSSLSHFSAMTRRPGSVDGEEPASPHHRAGVASMACRRGDSGRTRRKFDFHTGDHNRKVARSGAKSRRRTRRQSLARSRGQGRLPMPGHEAGGGRHRVRGPGTRRQGDENGHGPPEGAARRRGPHAPPRARSEGRSTRGFGAACVRTKNQCLRPHCVQAHGGQRDGRRRLGLLLVATTRVVYYERLVTSCCGARRHLCAARPREAGRAGAPPPRPGKSTTSQTRSASARRGRG